MVPPPERTNTVTVRLTEEEHATLAAFAAKDGLSQSDVLRQLLRARAAAERPVRRVKVPVAHRAEIVRVSLDEYTVVHDLAENRVLFQIAGILPLHVGAEIELTDPNVNARVTRVRLLAGNPATVCLDVVRPDR